MRIATYIGITFGFVLAIAATFIAAEAATTFNGSTIVSLDEAQQTITFRTAEGQVWTLPVTDPNLVKREQISQGDRVGIEIDLNDRIAKITKIDGRDGRSATADSQDER